jgi:hypothetical protein
MLVECRSAHAKPRGYSSHRQTVFAQLASELDTHPHDLVVETLLGREPHDLQRTTDP